VFLDDDLKKVRIAGLFRAGDVDGLLETLHAKILIYPIIEMPRGRYC